MYNLGFNMCNLGFTIDNVSQMVKKGYIEYKGKCFFDYARYP